MLVYQRVQVPVASLLGRFFPVEPWVSISGSDCGVGCKPLKIAMEAQWNPGTWNLYCWVAKLGTSHIHQLYPTTSPYMIG